MRQSCCIVGTWFSTRRSNLYIPSCPYTLSQGQILLNNSSVLLCLLLFRMLFLTAARLASTSNMCSTMPNAWLVNHRSNILVLVKCFHSPFVLFCSSFLSFERRASNNRGCSYVGLGFSLFSEDACVHGPSSKLIGLCFGNLPFFCCQNHMGGHSRPKV